MNSPQYRRVWERATGSKIPPGWHIHHVDRDRSNNAPSNLHAMPVGCHAKVHDFAGRLILLGELSRIRRLTQPKRPKKPRRPQEKSRFACPQCGKSWMAYTSKRIYCLPVCEVRAQMGRVG